MTTLSPEEFALVPLAIAAGLDLYLTLFVIGVATMTGLWNGPLPGALGDLAAGPVVLVVGVLYVLEAAAERSPAAGLLWNAFHALIRPLSGALLALLLLDGHSSAVVFGGAVLCGALTSLIHGARSGATFLRWVAPDAEPAPILVSLAEDTVVLGLATLAIDAPAWGALIAGVALLWVARPAPSWLRAFVYAVHTGVVTLTGSAKAGRWKRASELPSWVVGSIDERPEELVDELTRGAAAAGHGLPGVPLFVTGWLVDDDAGLLFLTRFGRAVKSVDVATMGPARGAEREPFRRVDLGDGRERMFLLLGPEGPSTASIVAAFPAQ